MQSSIVLLMYSGRQWRHHTRAVAPVSAQISMNEQIHVYEYA